MIVAIGQRLGFKPDGELQVFVTEPEEPADEQPFGYDINFTSYSEDEEDEAAMEEDRPKWLN
jgi:hypothetical protein